MSRLVEPRGGALWHRRRGARLAAALACFVLLLSSPGDRSPTFAPLATDGPPDVLRAWPTSSPLGGGTPVRITGQGFEGTTEVRFDDEPATELAVVDSNLIVAVAPPGAAGSLVAVTVEDDSGEVTSAPAFLYTDAALSVTPGQGLAPGTKVTVGVTGYLPDVFTVVTEASPLGALLEGGPAPPVGPSPYADPIAYPTTDATGSSSSVATLMSPFGSARDLSYDPGATCPPSQEAADHGLAKCWLTYGAGGAGALATPIALGDGPEPQNPIVTLAPVSTTVGSTVDLGGTGWTASPLFGSATEPEDPGETQLTVELCDTAVVTCEPASAQAAVDLTRYRDDDPAPGVQGELTGADLDGSLTVDDVPACAPDCVLKVTQQRADPLTGAPLPAEPIVSTAPLTVTDPSTTTTTDPADTFFSYSPTSGEPGTRVAFFGDGVDGVTGVSFVDPANAFPPESATTYAGADFRVDGPGLVSVTVPEGPEGLVDVVVEGHADGPQVVPGGFFVITPDLIFDVEPTTGLHPGDFVTVTVRNYVPGEGIVIAMVSPLINYSQPLPGTPPFESAPPPQATIVSFEQMDEDGNLSEDVVLPDPFIALDEQAACPVPQDQANAGLRQCILSVTVFGQGILEVPLSFAEDAVPEPPNLALDRGEAQAGDEVILAGQSWHGQPLLDSTTNNGGLSVELCGIGGNDGACRFVGDGDVLRTRYLFDWRDPASGELSGGQLAGTLTVPDDLGGPCDCFVRVRQDVAGTSSFLEATAPLAVAEEDEEPQVTTTTEAPDTVTTTTEPPSTTTTTEQPTAATTTTTSTPSNTTTTTRPSSDPPGPADDGGPDDVAVPPPPPPPPNPPGNPPPVPPGPPSPVVNPTPNPVVNPTPSPGAAPGAAPAPGNPVSNPGSAHREEEQAKAAEVSRHHFTRTDPLLARRDPGTAASLLAQGAVALAAAGAGCLLVLGGGAADRRRKSFTTTSDGRPRPRST